jgi:hypothetical protein
MILQKTAISTLLKLVKQGLTSKNPEIVASWTDFSNISQGRLQQQIALSNTAFRHFALSNIQDPNNLNELDPLGNLFPRVDRSAQHFTPDILLTLSNWKTIANRVKKNLVSKIEFANRTTKLNIFDQKHNQLRINKPGEYLERRAKFLAKSENAASNTRFAPLPTVQALQNKATSRLATTTETIQKTTQFWDNVHKKQNKTSDAEHKKAVWHDSQQIPVFPSNITNSLIAPFTLAELRDNAAKLSTGTSPGKDAIPNEVYKYIFKTNNHQETEKSLSRIRDCILLLFQYLLDGNPLISSWFEAIVTCIPKPNQKDKTDPAAFRPIALLNALYKFSCSCGFLETTSSSNRRWGP